MVSLEGLPSDELLQECFSLIGSLQKALQADVLRVPSSSHEAELSNFVNRSTIGVMLNGLEVDNLVVGGKDFPIGSF